MEKVLNKATVAQQDPLLPSSKRLALSVSKVEELLVRDSCHDSDGLLDISLDIHSLSEDEQEELSLNQYTAAASSAIQLDTSFLSLIRCAAEKLSIDWPFPPPTQKTLPFTGFFLPPEQTTVKNSLAMFPTLSRN